MTSLEFPAVPFTLTISLTLVVTFVVFFIREQRNKSFGGAERESLLPLADESSRKATVKAKDSESALLP